MLVDANCTNKIWTYLVIIVSGVEGFNASKEKTKCKAAIFFWVWLLFFEETVGMSGFQEGKWQS